MYCKVLIIPPNKDYIVLKLQTGKVAKFPRQYAKFVRVHDVGMLSQTNSRPVFKLLTDDDEIVIMNHPDRKQMVPYGYDFGTH